MRDTSAPSSSMVPARGRFSPRMVRISTDLPVPDPPTTPSHPPETATHILGFRDRDDQVRFVNLSPATAKLILLLNNGLAGQQALQAMNGGECPGTQFQEFGRCMLVELHQQDVIIDALPIGPLEL